MSNHPNIFDGEMGWPMAFLLAVIFCCLTTCFILGVHPSTHEKSKESKTQTPAQPEDATENK